MDTRTKLDIGCGDVRQGDDWIHIDISPKSVADYLWDVRKIPYPEEWAWENKFDYIRADNLAEHIYAYTWIKVVRELHRILKVGGILWIRVPNGKANFEKAFVDPTHVNIFMPGTFDYYDKFCPNQRWQHYGQMYGIPPFRRIRQVEDMNFIICELVKI